MLVATDVQYHESHAIAAAVAFAAWDDAVALREWTVRVEEVAPYVPGQFYKRELPCLLAVLEPVRAELALVIVDGYVWLGVAKTRFAGAAPVAEVRRGESQNPLFVSTAGVALDQATTAVQAMHGAHRLPTLLKRVDTLCRTIAAK